MEGNHKEGWEQGQRLVPQTAAYMYYGWVLVDLPTVLEWGPETEVIIPTDLTYWLTLNTHTNRSHGLQKCHIMSTGLLHTVGDCITLFPLTSHTDLTCQHTHQQKPLPIYCYYGYYQLQEVSHIMNILDIHTEATTFKGTHTCNQGDVRTLVSRG